MSKKTNFDPKRLESIPKICLDMSTNNYHPKKKELFTLNITHVSKLYQE